MSKWPQESGDESSIALNFITYLADDEDRLSRFCALSGLGIGELKREVGNPEFQGFLLDYALQDESLLLAFAAQFNIKPERIAAARRRLPGYSE